VWRRRRGRSTGLALGILLAAFLAVTLVAVVSVAAGRDRTASSWRLVIRAADGVILNQLELGDGRFAIRYRNSVYGSRAEERFSIGDDGRIHLVGLAADEAAVLGEYYGAREPRLADAGAAFRWEAAPAYPVTLERLLLAATDHGERTLVVDGQPRIALWRLVADTAPGLWLAAERVP
jgi:hypothetical protein